MTSTTYRIAHPVWQSIPRHTRRKLRTVQLIDNIATYVASQAPDPGLGDAVYSDDYFESLEETSAQGVQAIAESISTRLAPRRLVDAGCGTGVLLEHLKARGIEVLGLDKYEGAIEHSRRRGLDAEQCDFAAPGDLSLDGFDVAVSLEVALLLPEEAADGFVELLCQVKDTVVFSSGAPGQRAPDKRNDQPHEYWMTKFDSRGFRLDEALTQEFRRTWQANDTAWWFHKNVMVFRRETAAAG